ncbi:hypothetical protein [Antarctobacter jejuensis]|uniref:hypothetical protein n=1 Tax=Antarctobacter jejuensis TaxID=1439938 RepID=UPI003FCFC353
MVKVLKRLTWVACLTVTAGMAQAATIGASDGQGMGCLIRIDGPISAGDADSLAALLAEVPEPTPETPSRVGRRVCLNSTGGDLAESVHMGDMIAARFMGTAVPDAATCESACALMFLAGRYAPSGADAGFVPDRILHPRGRLGFHAPPLLVEDRSYQKDEVNRAYSSALSSMGEILRLRSKNGAGIPDSLFLTILNTPVNDMTYVETVEQAARWQIEVAPVSLTAADIEESMRFACLNADGGMLDELPSDSYLYGSANLPFNYGNLGDSSAQVSTKEGFRDRSTSGCRIDLDARGEPLDRIGYLTITGVNTPEDTGREVYAYMFHDPRLGIDHLPVASTAAETGEDAFFQAIRAAARSELSSVDFLSCWLTSPEARIVNVNEYVNLRAGPGFEAEVLRQVPLGERVRVIATQDLRAPEGGDRAQSCLKACNDLALGSDDADLRARVDRCISDNVFWYEIRDGANTAGFISRKYLGE